MSGVGRQRLRLLRSADTTSQSDNVLDIPPPTNSPTLCKSLGSFKTADKKQLHRFGEDDEDGGGDGNVRRRIQEGRAAVTHVMTSGKAVLALGCTEKSKTSG